jgi:predicted metallopeptidase
MFNPTTPTGYDRTQLRKMVRERVKAESKHLAKMYGIPKAFVQHARHHGQQVVDIIQAHMKHRDCVKREKQMPKALTY